jgi:hypothetical protein
VHTGRTGRLLLTGLKAADVAAIVITTAICSFLLCASQQITIEIRHDYKRERFSGRDLSSKLIGICPVLLKSGPVPDEALHLSDVVHEVRKDRKDLTIMTSDTLSTVLAERLTKTDLERYYHKLFTGEISFMQSADTFWHAVPSEYLLVPKVVHGMDISTFQKRVRKKFRLEAELWERKGMEVVWRLTVNCSSDDPIITHQKLLQNSLVKVLREFPVVIPNYEPGKW